MKTSGIITRTVIATSFLVTLAVPVASAYSDNANLGESSEVRQDGGAASANSENGTGRPDFWGGCRGIHGVDNPGGGLASGLAGGTATGASNASENANENANVPNRDCPTTPEEEVAGTSVDLPETR
jgi:hypothetical protein